MFGSVPRRPSVVSYANHMDVSLAANDLLRDVERRRKAISERLDPQRRAWLGQFFTPAPVADFIASLPHLPTSGRVRILDPGAGTGSLTAALLARVVADRPDLELAVTAFEIDERLRPELDATLDDCRRLAAGADVRMTTKVIDSDFLEWAASSVALGPLAPMDERFDLVIMNPPYRKVNVNASERRALESIGVEITNLYVAFIAMSVALLGEAGQIAAITPRSFTNGPYFRSFRRFFFDKMAFGRIHMYESRPKAFAGVTYSRRTSSLQPIVVALMIPDRRCWSRRALVRTTNHECGASRTKRSSIHGTRIALST